MRNCVTTLSAIVMIATASDALAQAPKNTKAEPARATLSLDTQRGGTPRAVDITTSKMEAPGLSLVRVYKVYSSNYGDWELIPFGAANTIGDHGGSIITVAVWEQGYADRDTRVATMGGVRGISSSQEENLCGTDRTTPINCSSAGRGSVITGHVVYYDVSGFDTGLFTFQASSLMFPQNTLRTSLGIR